MAVWDTEENGRTAYTARTLESLRDTVSGTHRIVIVDNGSCEETKQLLARYESEGLITVITLTENIGTARAVNKAWELRNKGEHCIKMDNDVVIHSAGWVNEMEACIALQPLIGIIGLKRKDCWEYPANPDPFYRSRLELLPHVAGEPWRVVEVVNHVMGTCQMFNSALLDKIGYLYQPRLYGFDDALAAVRCDVAGFASCFIPHINIDHIDTGDTAYQGWKHKVAGEDMDTFNEIKNAYRSGKRPIFEAA